MLLLATMEHDDINVIMKDLFPVAKKDCENFINYYQETTQEVREGLAGKVPMQHIEAIAEIIMIGRFGSAFAESQSILKRLFGLIPSKKRHAGLGVTDQDIARARELPIADMVKVRAHTTLCLWHDDSTPSMHVYPDNHAYCFVCAKRADAIDFWMQLKSLDFISAIKDMLHI